MKKLVRSNSCLIRKNRKSDYDNEVSRLDDKK